MDRDAGGKQCAFAVQDCARGLPVQPATGCAVLSALLARSTTGVDVSLLIARPWF
jgi:hypothetical protein